jgi:hypothetical protein
MECTVKSPFTDVFRVLGDSFGNVYARKFGKKGEVRIGVILGEELFFRVNSDVAILITVEEHSPKETKLQVMSCAGAAGPHLLGDSSYSAHSAYVQKVKDALLERGFKIEKEKFRTSAGAYG